jgi:hypothetical protein
MDGYLRAAPSAQRHTLQRISVLEHELLNAGARKFQRLFEIRWQSKSRPTDQPTASPTIRVSNDI